MPGVPKAERERGAWCIAAPPIQQPGEHGAFSTAASGEAKKPKSIRFGNLKL